MTTIASPDDGASSLEPGAVDPFRELHHLLPKLAQPSWVRLIGKQLKVTKPKPASTAAQKAARRNERKHERFARALAGAHTRVTRAA